MVTFIYYGSGEQNHNQENVTKGMTIRNWRTQDQEVIKMNKPKRPIICVVSAEANSIEQRQILHGIIEKSQEYGYDTAVLSNIYNPNISINSLECENKIYELVLSEQISAVILISESFVNEEIREAIAKSMLTKDVPMVVLGAHLEEFADSKFTFINTSDEDDTE